MCAEGRSRYTKDIQNTILLQCIGQNDNSQQKKKDAMAE